MEKCFHLCMGLPGSGKTHLLTQIVKLFELIDIDGVWDPDECIHSVYERLSDTIDIIEIYQPEISNGIGLDTLILTNDQLIKVLEAISSVEGMNEFKVIIHWFKPDREACLYNDQGRRSLECDFMIRRANLEEVDQDRINELFIKTRKFKELEVFKRTVVRKPLYKRSEDVSRFIYENAVFESEDVIKSEEWIVYSDYNNMNIAIPEKEKDFHELTRILNKFAPNLTPEEYKRVWSLVTKERRTNFGYYALYYEYCVWNINLRDLFELLKEMDYVEDGEEELIIKYERY